MIRHVVVRGMGKDQVRPCIAERGRRRCAPLLRVGSVDSSCRAGRASPPCAPQISAARFGTRASGSPRSHPRWWTKLPRSPRVAWHITTSWPSCTKRASVPPHRISRSSGCALTARTFTRAPAWRNRRASARPAAAQGGRRRAEPLRRRAATGSRAAAPAQAPGSGARAAAQRASSAREMPPPTITTDGLRTTIAAAMPRASRSRRSSSTREATRSPAAAAAKTISASIAAGSPPASSSNAVGSVAAARRAMRANALPRRRARTGRAHCSARLVVEDWEVADLAGRASGSPVDVAADQDAAADADADRTRNASSTVCAAPRQRSARRESRTSLSTSTGQLNVGSSRLASSIPSHPASWGASVTRPDTGSTTPGVPTPTAFRLSAWSRPSRARGRPRRRRARAGRRSPGLCTPSSAARPQAPRP